VVINKKKAGVGGRTAAQHSNHRERFPALWEKKERALARKSVFFEKVRKIWELCRSEGLKFSLQTEKGGRT